MQSVYSQALADWANLGKAWSPLSLKQSVEKYHYLFYRRMDLALNNPSYKVKSPWHSG